MFHRRTVGIFIFDAVEVLDFCGPFEVFATTSAPTTEPPDDVENSPARLFDVRIVAEEQRIIRARGNLRIEPHHTIEDCPPLDVLVVPGGYGTRLLLGNQRVLDWIVAQNEQVETMTSVCTGAFLLAKAGLLDGKRATTHWSGIGWMREHFPSVTTLDDVRVVDEGRMVTSAGISAGIDMALHLVARYHGRAIAETTARYMEYEWRTGS